MGWVVSGVAFFSVETSRWVGGLHGALCKSWELKRRGSKGGMDKGWRVRAERLTSGGLGAGGLRVGS